MMALPFLLTETQQLADLPGGESNLVTDPARVGVRIGTHLVQTLEQLKYELLDNMEAQRGIYTHLKPALGSLHPVVTHTSTFCVGTVTPSRPAYACHGGSTCPFDEPDNWESHEPTWDDPL